MDGFDARRALETHGKLVGDLPALGGTLDPEPDPQSPFFDEQSWRESAAEWAVRLAYYSARRSLVSRFVLYLNMIEMNKDLKDTLDYFEDSCIRRHNGASDVALAEVESHLKCSFPSSARAFLKVHDGLDLIDHKLFGVHDILQETLDSQRIWANYDWLVIAHNASGDFFVLLTDKTDQRGEHPVAQIDHETGEIMFIVGSCYERFVWFLLDNLRKQFDPNGQDKELEDDDDEELTRPWPYGDAIWIKQHDPQIAQWLVNDDAN